MAPWRPTTDVVIAPWIRNERAASAGLKTISYADNVIAYRYAHRQRRRGSGLRQHRGQLCEGTGTNVAVAYEGRMVTPTLAAGCLPGVTRELLLEWVPEFEQFDVPIEALESATKRSSRRPVATCTRSAASARRSCQPRPAR